MAINGTLFVKDDTGDGSVRGTGADNTANKIKAASGYETELNDGVIVVKKTTSNSYYYYPATTTDSKTSPKTFDAGVGIYAVTAVLSVTGMAWVGKKRH